MKIRTKLNPVLFVLLFFVFTLQSFGQKPEDSAKTLIDPGYTAKIAQARILIQAHMDSTKIPGLTAAVSIDGKIVWAEGFGLADIENQVPVTPLTKMRIGSISKPLTSAAVGLLYEQGKLDLDAPVQKYVAYFPQKKYPISTRQVAGHLAGIRHYKGQEFLISKHYNSVRKGLNIFKEDSLLFKPGERYSYSSYGWNLVSAVVEGASGERFLSYMQKHIFEPLGMKNTLADQPYHIIHRRTRFYSRNFDNKIYNSNFVDNSYKWAGGGYLSTAEDLLIFANGIMTGRLLKPETIDLLFTSMETNSGKKTIMVLGGELEPKMANE